MSCLSVFTMKILDEFYTFFLASYLYKDILSLYGSFAVGCRGVRDIAQSVERETPGEEILSSIPTAAARSLLVGLVSE